jgi:hypothetical protein
MEISSLQHTNYSAWSLRLSLMAVHAESSISTLVAAFTKGMTMETPDLGVGDAIFFSSNLSHGSGIVEVEEPRHSLVARYSKK